MMRDLERDFRHGARALRRSPGFLAVALLTIALGIGANTAIFSVVHRVLLHPATWPEPERVAVIGWDWGGRGETWGLTPAKAQFWKESSQSFAAFAIADQAHFVLTGEGSAEQLEGELVSQGYFEVVGIVPALGRAFVPEEDLSGGPPVVILSDALWRRSFGGDPGIVGRQLMLNGLVHTVVGVMPPDFQGARVSGADVLAPLRLDVDPSSQGHNYFSFGRLAAGVTHERLQSEVAALTDRFDRAHPGVVDEGHAFRFVRYNEYLVGDFLRTAVWMLFAAVGAVLLIACANVTSLLLGRVDGRRRELAVRAALGASRSRIAGHVVAESLVLTMLGGALGLLFARWGLDAILALAPEDLPGLDRVGLSTSVLGFTLMLSVVTGVVVGLAGAVPVLRTNLATTLKEAGRAQTTAPGRVHARGLLILTEAAFSVVLLVGAALLLVSFLRLRAVELGFDPEGVYTIELRLPPDRYSTTEATWRFESQVLERLRTLPGVSDAGSASNLPLVRGLNTGATVVSPGPQQHDVVEFRAVSPEFLDIIGARLVEGRGFSQSDHAGAPSVALVNEAFVRRFLAQQKPLGATLRVDDPERTVIGVLRDTKDMGLRWDPQPTIFAPRSQTSDGATRAMNEWFIAAFVIRTDRPSGLASTLRRAVQGVDPEQPILRMRPMADVVAASIAPEQFNARLLVTFGWLALVLTAVGVYGVVSYSVGQRTHEIGLRMALGARRSGVVYLVVWQGMVMVAVGLAIGLVAAFALSRMLSGMLFGITASDPATFAGVVLLLASVAALASYIPARRASRVDPLIALRSQ